MAGWKQTLHSKNRDMRMQDIEDALATSLVKCILEFGAELCADKSKTGWILRVAEHELANIRKKQKRLIFPDPIQWEACCARLVTFNDNQVLSDDLHAFMNRYPALLEVVLLLEEGLSAHEIAEKLRISDAAAQKRIERVRKVVEIWRNSPSAKS